MKNKLRLSLILVVSFLGLFVLFNGSSNNNVSAKQVYDVSEFQNNIGDRQAHNLKHEVNFMILRAQYGTNRQDYQFNHNAYEMSKYHIPYGAYSYSLYSNSAQARTEADDLYRRAPRAHFYVNDSEENRAGKDLNKATYNWASEIHRLTNKPAILYSSLSFMNHFTPKTRNHYNALWLADYTSIQPHPGYNFALWQYSDNHYSKALGKRVDASIFPSGLVKKMSFWTGKHRRNSTHFYVTINGRKEKVLKSLFKRASHHRARKHGFRRGPTIDGTHTIFNRHKPNNRRAIIPRNYRIISNKTLWLVHRHTNNLSVINRIHNAYYYNAQYKGWIRI